ncbi:MAG TPA: cyclic pyranopterin monophosphate synthase MoaC [Tepidisphaeraceae bacterium]|nr:cyclic pyranopterin monophosphate synthase MoaC [Tepidisphaeraceae bacterium]
MVNKSRTRSPLTHLDSAGRARMVDVSGKKITARRAMAEGFVQMRCGTLRAISEHRIGKGEVLGTARLAGIMAAKRTSQLIPLCHGLNVESVEVDFELPGVPATMKDHEPVRLRILAVAQIAAKTGVEMEALTAVAIAALTIYDMCKAVDRAMIIDSIRLLEKSGGKSGTYIAKQ